MCVGQYVVEIDRSEHRDIPPEWTLLSSTKQKRRYHTPEVRELLQKRAQHKEALVAEAHKAYLSFLTEIVDKYYALLRDAVNKLAVTDCLFSLAQVAAQGGYCRPEFVERKEDCEDVLEIVKGRHPMIEAIRTDPFVPNSLTMGGSDSRHKIITGPNMGGKSSTVRMTALCAIVSYLRRTRCCESAEHLYCVADGSSRVLRTCRVDEAVSIGWRVDENGR